MVCRPERYSRHRYCGCGTDVHTLPKGLTASTGLDALTHAIEGLITKGAWEMSDVEIKGDRNDCPLSETAVFELTT